MKLNASED